MTFIPSDAQWRAIAHKDGPLLVLAGPGSGKTAVITERIRCLIETHHIPQEQILVITFTKAAAEQLKSRFLTLTASRYPLVTVKTFHSLFYLILQKSSGSYGRILSASQQTQLAKSLLQKDQKPLSAEAVQDFLTAVSRIKTGIYNKKTEETCIFSEDLPLLYGRYENLLRDQNKMDMDDLLLKTYGLLKTDEKALAFWQKRFCYILIDEFQDISLLQFQIMYLLAGKQQNFFAVGDDDQSIYRFRGASPQIMLDFFRYFPEADQILLDQNYRCGKTITEGAERLISHNKKRYEKKILSASREKGAVQIRIFASAMQEASYIVKDVLKRAAPAQTAVLYRNRRQSLLLCRMLLQTKIPFVMKDGPDPLRHWIVSDILAYAETAINETPQNILRVLNKPFRGLSKNMAASLGSRLTLHALEDACADLPDAKNALQNWQAHNRYLKNLAPLDGVMYIREAMGYDRYLVEYAKNTGQDPEEYRQILALFLKSMEGIESWAAYKSWLREMPAQRNNQNTQEENALYLSTMHGAKGLEFDIVYILDVNEGCTPCKKPGAYFDGEEERRLFYVAMTRAKKELQLLAVKNEELQPSVYLKEAFGEQWEKMLVSC